MRKIPFWKMHGAGNDFVLVDDRAGVFPVADREWMAAMAARRTGVGCEGIILIQNAPGADFRMRFFNPDGSEVEMCGNGARCVARLAHEIGAAPAEMSIDTVAGLLRATVLGEDVRMAMTPPRDWRLNRSLEAGGGVVRYHYVNSGVPHVVIETDDLASVDVAGLGAAVRYHADFAPAGTNVNFVAVDSPQQMRVRTYERGVEAETLACGTGVAASGLIAGRLGRCRPPVRITCASGHVLEVGYRLSEAGASELTLLGPATHVFTGELTYPRVP